MRIFELRSRDVAAFTYLGSELRIIQNITINRWIDITPPPAAPPLISKGCLKAIGVIIAVILLLLYLLIKYSS